MIRIGLTGSIAMGKSEVAKIFAAEGLPVFDSDKAVHELYASPRGARLIEAHFPSAIIAKRVDRQKLSAHLQNHPEDLANLETIVHAEVAHRRETFAAEMQQRGHWAIVFDVPLLFEKGNERQVDVTVVVSAPEQDQTQRALARPGMTREKLKLILNRQMPDAEKRRRGNYIIENNGTLEHLQNQTRAVIADIKKAHQT